MKSSKREIETRRKRLYDLISASDSSNAETLSAVLKVSPVTIRRDLRHLEDLHLVKTYYGGVRPIHRPQDGEQSLAGQTDLIEQRRHAIAKYAASLVEDGDLVVLNTSSTCLLILQYIEAKNVVVITNNGNAIKAQHQPELSVMLTGGEIRWPKESLVGDFAIRNLLSISADKCFVGCSGLSVENGMSTENANEVALNEVMLQRVAKKAYIIADGTKIGKASNYISAPLNRISHVITDEFAPKAEIDRMRELGVDVVQVAV